MKHIFFSILTALAFCHCQAPAPAPKNTLQCYVRFDAAARKSKAEATVLEGASKKVIEWPGGIRFQSMEMKVLPVRGITYSVEYPAKYTEEQVFEWKNEQGEQNRFKLQLPAIDSFFFDHPALSIKEFADLHWIGEPLHKGETLVFIWENATDGKTVPMEVSTTLGAPLIEIPAAKLSQLGAGDWSLYLVRKELKKSEAANFIVESTAEYYTQSIPVKLK